MATQLEKATAAGKSIEAAVADLLPKVIKENKRIIFNGNNYAKEWEKEAVKRGLLNQKNTVEALPNLIAKDVIGIFEKYKVLNEREVHARYEGMVETYKKTGKALDSLTKLANQFKGRTDKLEKALGHEGPGTAEQDAKHFRGVVVPAMS